MIWQGIQTALRRTPFSRQATARVIAPVLRQLSSLLRAGVPIVQALQHLELALPDKRQREYTRSMQAAVANGSSLASVWADRIPLLLVLLLATGEHVGGFADAIHRWTTHFERQTAWRATCVRLLSYPLCLAVLSVALMDFLANQVLPTFSQMEAQFGHPPATPVAVQWQGILYGFRQLLTALVACVVISAVVFLVLRKYAPGVWHKIRRRFPGYNLIRMWRTRLFCMLLGTLVQAGIPVLAGLEHMRRLHNRGWMPAISGKVRTNLLSGQRLTTAFEGDWDTVFTTLLRTAEQTGELAEALLETERITGEQLAAGLQGIAKIAQPLLTFLTGGMVTLVMLALYAPMYDMITQLSGGGIT